MNKFTLKIMGLTYRSSLIKRLTEITKLDVNHEYVKDIIEINLIIGDNTLYAEDYSKSEMERRCDNLSKLDLRMLEIELQLNII